MKNRINQKQKHRLAKPVSRILAAAVLLCFAVGCLPYDALAAIVYGSGQDNTFATANVISIGDMVSGSITETDDLDYYTFTLDGAGRVTLDMTSYMRYYCIRIYDSDGEEIWYTNYNEWTETVGYRRDTYDVYLEQGTYYMQVNGYKYGTDYKSTGRYECGTSFLSSGVTNTEDDNSFAAANDVVLGSTIVGQISRGDDLDTFRFTLAEPGCVTLDMTSYMRYYCMRIYDSDGEEIWYTNYNEWNENVGYRKDAYNIVLSAGTYYMQINGYKYGTDYKSTGKYVVDTQYETFGASFGGDDNSFADANSISLETVYTGQISIDDDFDTYRFELPTARTVVVDITSYMKYYCILLYDSDGEEIWYTNYNEWNENAGYRKDAYNIVLSAGTYYMQINGYKYGTDYKSTGKYVFSVAGLTQKNCVHEYEKETVAATYFKKGYTLYTCEICGYQYKDSYTAKRKLEPVSLLNYYASVGKRKIRVYWSENSDASGYQLRYSTSKSFKKNVVTITVKKNATNVLSKKLKRKTTYHLQVRPYKKSGSNTVYGKWSEKKRMKTT